MRCFGGKHWRDSKRCDDAATRGLDAVQSNPAHIGVDRDITGMIEQSRLAEARERSQCLACLSRRISDQARIARSGYDAGYSSACGNQSESDRHPEICGSAERGIDAGRPDLTWAPSVTSQSESRTSRASRANIDRFGWMPAAEVSPVGCAIQRWFSGSQTP